MPTILFTDVLLRSLKAEQRTDFWDAKTPGFGVRVGGRTKTFIAKVNNRRHTIGLYPTIALAEARRKALAIKSGAQAVAVSNVTFEQAYEKFKAAHVAGKKERTQKDYKRVLDKYFLPELCRVRLISISSARIGDITDPLLDRPSEYAHALAVARMFFRWCVRPPRHYLTHSPLEGIRIAKQPARDRVLTDEELVKVWRVAHQLGHPFGTITKLCLTLGQRRTQTASVAWAWIDTGNRTITFPGDVMKGGKPHIIPYSDLTASILKDIPNTGHMLFPARGKSDQPFNGWSKCTEAMRKELLDVSHFTPHDWRRTFASGLQKLRVRLEITEALLGHVSGSLGGIRGVYQRYDYAAEKREAITLWEKYIASLVSVSEDRSEPRAA